MRKRVAGRLAAAVAAAILAACSDVSGPEPRMEAPAGPAGSKAPGSSTYFSLASCAGDCRAALQAAVNTYEVVTMSADSFPLEGTVTLPSRTRIVGAGAGSTRIAQLAAAGGNPGGSVADRRNVFIASGDASEPVRDIHIEGIRFYGAGIFEQAALRVEKGDSIVFQNNDARAIGLVQTGSYFDANANPGAMAAQHRTSRVHVKDNTGRGTGNTGGLWAIELGYVNGAVVTGNQVAQYRIGIQWWGGEADALKGNYTASRWVQNVRIDGNRVDTTESGIWGTNGDYVRASGNTVRDCLDVCLDAEGSNDVAFTGNWVYNAGEGALAVFFNSSNIRFAWNEVHQDGRYAQAVTGVKRWDVLFKWQGAYGSAAGKSVYIHNNWLYYDGPAGTGVGQAWKEQTEYFQFVNNTLKNTVVIANPLDGGHLEITGNTMTFDRTIDAPHRAAIEAGSTHTSAGVTYNVHVSGNDISSTVSQSATGIFARQYYGGGAIETYMNGNVVRNFPRSIHIFNDLFAHRYWVTNNQTTGTVTTQQTNSVWPVVTYSGNTTI
ncbi:MAG TPA: right-handed parallel beta-helix repeat-containing protein [Longimicrobium sp.]